MKSGTIIRNKNKGLQQQGREQKLRKGGHFTGGVPEEKGVEEKRKEKTSGDKVKKRPCASSRIGSGGKQEKHPGGDGGTRNNKLS